MNLICNWSHSSAWLDQLETEIDVVQTPADLPRVEAQRVALLQPHVEGPGPQ